MKYVMKGSPPTPSPTAAVTLSAEVTRRLRELRMGRFKRPADEKGDVHLNLPADLTDPNDTELGKLFTRALSLLVWSKGVATLHDVDYLEAKRRRDVAKARAFLLSTGAREERAARVILDDEVQAAEQSLLIAQAMAKTTSVIADGYEDARNGISREFTRRQSLETEGRGTSGAPPSRRSLR